MGKEWQKSQEELAFIQEVRGEASRACREGAELSTAIRDNESLTKTERSMEEICERNNMLKAWKRVRSNKGSPGIDGMTVEATWGYLQGHWAAIREQLFLGRYKPRPVRRVNIPKPEGGERKLGIPTVTDRLIQQAILQVLQKRWDPTFSEHSFGFRPGRSAHQAVAKAQEYIAEGHRWVVDIDLEKFFDRVNHDRLMAHVAKREKDKRLLKLIRAYLNAGVMENGLVSPTTEGTPQGGPLSPLLSNLVLDELDRELERRGHRFVRYADDCKIYVRSERAGQRVMESITRFITKKLKLRVNEAKSRVVRAKEHTFLGFGFTNEDEPRRRISPKALKRLKRRIKELTRRSRGISLKQMVEQLTIYLRGWCAYFGFCQTPSVLKALNSWIRRQLRCFCWKQWKRGRVRFKQLRSLGIGKDLAAQTAGSAHGPWRLSCSPALAIGLPNAFFDSLGLLQLAVR